MLGKLKGYFEFHLFLSLSSGSVLKALLNRDGFQRQERKLGSDKKLQSQIKPFRCKGPASFAVTNTHSTDSEDTPLLGLAAAPERGGAGRGRAAPTLALRHRRGRGAAPGPPGGAGEAGSWQEEQEAAGGAGGAGGAAAIACPFPARSRARSAAGRERPRLDRLCSAVGSRAF